MVASFAQKPSFVAVRGDSKGCSREVERGLMAFHTLGPIPHDLESSIPKHFAHLLTGEQVPYRLEDE